MADAPHNEALDGGRSPTVKTVAASSREATERLVALCEWMQLRLVEPARNLHVPALLDGDSLLERAAEHYPQLAELRECAAEVVYRLLDLNETRRASNRRDTEQARALLSVERRLSIVPLLHQLALTLRSIALYRAAHAPNEDEQGDALRVASHAGAASVALDSELRTLLALA